MKVNKRQVGGDHYQSSYQHWDLIAEHGVGYLEGCATKYASRWRKKNGVQDLEKAVHYVDKMLELCRAGDYTSSGFVSNDHLQHFFVANDIADVDEMRVIQFVCQWDGYVPKLERAKKHLKNLLKKARQTDLTAQQ